MTEDLIAMAREAGFRSGNITMSDGDQLPFVAPVSATSCIVELERFATLIEARAEARTREECAKVCDVLYAPASCNAIERALWSVAMQGCAAAIRERKSP